MGGMLSLLGRVQRDLLGRAWRLPWRKRAIQPEPAA